MCSSDLSGAGKSTALKFLYEQDGQVIHTVEPHILKKFQRRRFARARHACNNDQSHGRFLLKSAQELYLQLQLHSGLLLHPSFYLHAESVDLRRRGPVLVDDKARVLF